MKNLQNFIECLRKYESGEISLEKIKAAFEGLDRFHDFWHYISDSDIREKNAEYAEMQNNELKRFISALENKDYDLAQRITFLGNSGV